LIVNSGKFSDEIGDVTFRVNQGLIGVNNLGSIVHVDGDFSNFSLLRTLSCCFYIDNTEQFSYFLFGESNKNALVLLNEKCMVVMIGAELNSGLSILVLR